MTIQEQCKIERHTSFPNDQNPGNFVDGEVEAEDSRRGRAVEDSLAVDMVPFRSPPAENLRMMN